MPVSAPPDGAKVYTPTPTQAQALWSDKTFRVLVSARGEGKTTTAYMCTNLYALQKPQSRWPLRVAVVRDTRRNLGITTALTIKEWSPEGETSFWVGKDKEPESCVVNGPEGTPLLEFYFFGVDSATDMNRFQSFECDAIWIEEPAPAADISGGISKDVLGIVVTSLRRGADPVVLISSNLPDEDHWLAVIWQLPGAHQPDLTEEEAVSYQWIRDRSIVCIIPPGENIHLTAKDPEYRERNYHMLMVAGRPDLINRLVHGKVGNVQVGEPVTPEYGSQYEVEVIPAARPGDRLLCSWDPEQSPSMVLWRPTPGSYCDILAAFQGINMGVQQLIEIQVKPWLDLHVPPRYQLIHTGDPNTLTADKSNSKISATKVILNLLGGREWISGPIGVEDRRLPMHTLLNRYHQGRPWIRIHKPHCAPLIKALASGWHYKKSPSGQIAHHWVKDQWADIGESFAYGCAYWYTRQDADSTMQKYRAMLAQQARVREPRSRTGV